MAVARLVCGRCGGVLSPGEKFCAQCGERVEHEASLQQGKSPEQQPSAREAAHSQQPCVVCGHTNVQPGLFCESCGSRLVAEDSAGASSSPDRSSSRKVKAPAYRFERWQIGVAVALVILLGYFVYQEINRDHGTAHDHQLPPQQQHTSLAGDIERLEQQVSRTPGDAGAILQLANTLHDASQTEPRYLMKAIDTYKKYLGLKPSDPNARVDLGICYFEVGRLDSSHAGQFFGMAMKEMKAAIQEHPTHQSAAFNLGIVTLYAGDPVESNKWFRKVVEINPESDLGRRAKNLLEQHSFPAQ